jgi:hypothetical protein
VDAASVKPEVPAGQKVPKSPKEVAASVKEETTSVKVEAA